MKGMNGTRWNGMELNGIETENKTRKDKMASCKEMHEFIDCSTLFEVDFRLPVPVHASSCGRVTGGMMIFVFTAFDFWFLVFFLCGCAVCRSVVVDPHCSSSHR
jgi:hypothetical protein